MDPFTSDGGPGCYLHVFKTGPPWGPAGEEDRPVFGPARVGPMSGSPPPSLRDPWAVVGGSFAENGSACKPMGSHFAPTNPPPFWCFMAPKGAILGPSARWRAKTRLACHRPCLSIRTRAPFHCCLPRGPPDGCLGSRVLSPSSQDRPHVRGLAHFGAGIGLAEELELLSGLQRPLGALGPLLGDHSVGKAWPAFQLVPPFGDPRDGRGNICVSGRSRRHIGRRSGHILSGWRDTFFQGLWHWVFTTCPPPPRPGWPLGPSFRNEMFLFRFFTKDGPEVVAGGIR